MSAASEKPEKQQELPVFVPGLYLVGTPIGNLEDLGFRAHRILTEADVVLAEDTRHTRKLLDRHGIDQRPVSYHKFNEASRCDWICEQIEQGHVLALVTDGGMPGISDPGSRAVRAVRARGLYVSVVPGPSAVSATVAMSGLGDKGYLFAGFLAVKSGRRARETEELLATERCVVLFESPHRILKLLGELAAAAPEREVFVAREITKKFEECFAGSAAEILEAYGERKPKGEFVVVISGV